MEIERNREKHDQLSTDFQIVVIDVLNRVLKENEIKDKHQRQSICERFSESFGNFVDQGWFASPDTENTKTYPLLCYAERGEWSDLAVGKVVKVIFPNPTSFLYETFSESCEWYFDEKDEELGSNFAVGEC